MATSMHLVWSSAAPGSVVYETHAIEVVEEGGVHGEVVSERHEVTVRSRAHAEEIAAEHDYELYRDGPEWESLPEEHETA
ncbi:hypothetical protein ACH4FX_25810 [Streptomyces sp. NPDC018019]|uniref:hypothetical protein n=1 Tax=Streptomyces sp. NPDC018019 TaxID=3365030 RepID=UPI0037B09B70